MPEVLSLELDSEPGGEQGDASRELIEGARKRVEDKQVELKKLERIILSAKDIEETETLSQKVEEMALQVNDIEKAFGFSVSSGTVEVLEKIKDKENFVYTGLEALEKSGRATCPFCEQSVHDGENYLHIIQEYEKVFDDEFLDNQGKAKIALKEYKDSLLGLLELRAPGHNSDQLIRVNKLLGQSESLPGLVLGSDEQRLIREEIRRVGEKLREPLKRADDDGPAKIDLLISAINERIRAYNARVSKINALLGKTKKELREGGLAQRKRVLEGKLWEAKLHEYVLKDRAFLLDIKAQIEIHKHNEEKLNKLRELLHLYIERVSEKFREFSKTYFADIETYVQRFCPSLELQMFATRGSYDLRAGDVLCGFEVRYKGKDRLGELSEGEMQSIALAFFLALLKKTPQKNEKIVIFDDPITSFDAGKRRMCAEYVLKEVIPFAQTFIFTCDPLFRAFCLKVIGRRFGNDLSYYYILKSASSSIHYRDKHQWKIYSIFKSEFENLGSVAGTDENIIVYGQKLRYCIEEVKDKYLGYGQDAFNNILTQVQHSDFEKFHSAIDELSEIYNYCNTGGLAHYPRDGQTSWDELKVYIGRYMRLKL